MNFERLNMMTATIETVLRTLDCPITDDDRIAAADEIKKLNDMLSRSITQTWRAIVNMSKSADLMSAAMARKESVE